MNLPPDGLNPMRSVSTRESGLCRYRIASRLRSSMAEVLESELVGTFRENGSAMSGMEVEGAGTLFGTP